jgi:glyoxylase-like metal-dependent hydrolase (beta-lactamase superfamily II)
MRSLDVVATTHGKVSLETIQASPMPELPRLEAPRPGPRKRGYSTAFRPKGKGARYLVDAIPETLWREVRRKAKREGLSLRALILTLLEQWTAEDCRS